MTIALYIMRLLATRCLLSLIALSFLLELFDLFNNARELLSRGGQLPSLATYAVLRFPAIVENALPIAMLVGALITLLFLARSNEMTALRSAGITTYRILAIGLPVALIAGALHFLLIDRIAPWSERHFLSWWSRFEPTPADQTEATAVWLRNADTVLRVGGFGTDGDSLRDIKIVQLAESGTVTGWIDAEEARRGAAGWKLLGVRRHTIEHGRISITEDGDQLWPGPLDPASIVDLSQPRQNISTAHIRRILQGTVAGGNSPNYYRTQLHHSYALALASPLMLLLAAPAAFSQRRSGGAGRGLAIGFGLGMGYLLIDGILSAFGEANVLPPMLAAWAAPLLFALIGGSVLLQYEE
jgi:lipopolysaccharide export system permease protein